nr:TIGR02300 family protein [Sphingomonas crusticola]
MVKPEWGTKRSCPKCGTRFYDLGKDDPISCVECGTNFEAETVLKSKQPMPFDAPKPAAQKETEDADLAEDLDVDEDEEPSADDDVDLGGDDDIGVDTGEKEEDH